MTHLTPLLTSYYRRQSPLGRLTLSLLLAEGLGSLLALWGFARGVSTPALLILLSLMSAGFLWAIAGMVRLLRRPDCGLTKAPPAADPAGRLPAQPSATATDGMPAEPPAILADDKEDSGEYARFPG